jgi:hypothetical protein
MKQTPTDAQDTDFRTNFRLSDERQADFVMRDIDSQSEQEMIDI